MVEAKLKKQGKMNGNVSVECEVMEEWDDGGDCGRQTKKGKEDIVFEVSKYRSIEVLKYLWMGAKWKVYLKNSML